MKIPYKLGIGLFLSAALSALPLQAEEFYLLKDTPEDVALKIESSTISRGGVADSSAPGVTTRKGVEVTSRRVVHRTFLADGLGGKVYYRMLVDEFSTVLDGKVQNLSGPLSGKTVVGMKNGAGNRAFMLEEGVAVGDQVQELKRIEAIENRRWLPGRKVRIGETWEFVPGYIRSVLRRDLPSAVVIGMMTLRNVEVAPSGRRRAVIDCSIRGGGEEAKGVTKVIGAEALLTGTLLVDLDRPGDVAFRLTGAVVTGARVGDAKSEVKMPVTMTFRSTPLGK